MKHTPREKQIIDLLLQGCSNAEIGEQLQLKTRTIKENFHRLFMKHQIDDPKKIKRVVLAVKMYQESLKAPNDITRQTR